MSSPRSECGGRTKTARGSPRMNKLSSRYRREALKDVLFRQLQLKHGKGMKPTKEVIDQTYEMADNMLQLMSAGDIDKLVEQHSPRSRTSRSRSPRARSPRPMSARGPSQRQQRLRTPSPRPMSARASRPQQSRRSQSPRPQRPASAAPSRPMTPASRPGTPARRRRSPSPTPSLAPSVAPSVAGSIAPSVAGSIAPSVAGSFAPSVAGSMASRGSGGSGRQALLEAARSLSPRARSPRPATSDHIFRAGATARTPAAAPTAATASAAAAVDRGTGLSAALDVLYDSAVQGGAGSHSGSPGGARRGAGSVAGSETAETAAAGEEERRAARRAAARRQRRQRHRAKKELSPEMQRQLEALRLEIQEYIYKKNKLLRNTFRQMDKDGSGQLDCDELRAVFARANIGLSAPPAVFRALFDLCDLDGSGSIDFNEFAATLKIKDGAHYGIKLSDGAMRTESGRAEAMTPQLLSKVVKTKIAQHATTLVVGGGQWERTPASLQRLFREFDVNSAGDIDEHELMHTLRFKLGLRNLRPDEVRALLRHWDADGDGLINYSDFVSRVVPHDFHHALVAAGRRAAATHSLETCRLVTHVKESEATAARHRAIATIGVERLHEILREKVERFAKSRTTGKWAVTSPHVVRRIFRLFDADGSGSLSHHEFKSALRQHMGLTNVSETDLDALVAAYDVDGDGEISYDEFVRRLIPDDFSRDRSFIDFPGLTAAQKDRMSRVHASEAVASIGLERLTAILKEKVERFAKSRTTGAWAVTSPHAVRAIFRIFDTDNSGSLSHAEFGSALRMYCGLTNVSSADMAALAQYYDADGDGTISLEEFVQKIIPHDFTPGAGAGAGNGSGGNGDPLADKLRSQRAAALAQGGGGGQGEEEEDAQSFYSFTTTSSCTTTTSSSGSSRPSTAASSRRTARPSAGGGSSSGSRPRTAHPASRRGVAAPTASSVARAKSAAAACGKAQRGSAASPAPSRPSTAGSGSLHRKTGSGARRPSSAHPRSSVRQRASGGGGGSGGGAALSMSEALLAQLIHKRCTAAARALEGSGSGNGSGGASQQLLASLDADRDGRVCEADFVTSFSHALSLPASRAPELRALFRRYDGDGDGFLSADEFRQGVLRLPPQAPPAPTPQRSARATNRLTVAAAAAAAAKAEAAAAAAAAAAVASAAAASATAGGGEGEQATATAATATGATAAATAAAATAERPPSPAYHTKSSLVKMARVEREPRRPFEPVAAGPDPIDSLPVAGVDTGTLQAQQRHAVATLLHGAASPPPTPPRQRVARVGASRHRNLAADFRRPFSRESDWGVDPKVAAVPAGYSARYGNSAEAAAEAAAAAAAAAAAGGAAAAAAAAARDHNHSAAVATLIRGSLGPIVASQAPQERVEVQRERARARAGELPRRPFAPPLSDGGSGGGSGSGDRHVDAVAAGMRTAVHGQVLGNTSHAVARLMVHQGQEGGEEPPTTTAAAASAAVAAAAAAAPILTAAQAASIRAAASRAPRAPPPPGGSLSPRVATRPSTAGSSSSGRRSAAGSYRSSQSRALRNRGRTMRPATATATASRASPRAAAAAHSGEADAFTAPAAVSHRRRHNKQRGGDPSSSASGRRRGGGVRRRGGGGSRAGSATSSSSFMPAVVGVSFRGLN